MATTTIGTTGRDYATLAAWASYVNALALSAPEVGEVYNDGTITDTAAVTVGGWTGGSSTNTVTLRPAAGQGFGSHANKLTNALRWNQANGAAFTNGTGYTPNGVYQFNGAHLIVEGLQFRSTSGSSTTVGWGATGSSSKLQRSIVESNGSGANGIITGSSAAGQVLGNLLYTKSNGFGIGAAFSTTTEYIGNTIRAVGGGIGVRSRYSSNLLVQNNAVVGFTTDFSVDSGGTFSASSGFNATSNGTFGNANAGQSGQVSVADSDFESVTAGAEDFRLSASAAKLPNNGTTAGLTTDIVGTTRSVPYDIGAWEKASAGAPPAGTVTIGTITPGTTTASVAFSYDDSDQTGFEYRLDGGTAASAGTTSPLGLTGLDASTEYDIEIRAVNASGSGAWSTPATFTTNAISVPSITTQPLKNNTGTLLASTTIDLVAALDVTDLSVVATWAAIATEATGELILEDAALVEAADYLVVTSNTAGTAVGVRKYTAA